jgi:hypothetical protein
MLKRLVAALFAAQKGLTQSSGNWTQPVYVELGTSSNFAPTWTSMVFRML